MREELSGADTTLLELRTCRDEIRKGEHWMGVKARVERAMKDREEKQGFRKPAATALLYS